MPTALVLRIRPRAAGIVPGNLGRATHAAVLRLIAAADPELTARIHDDDGRKPLTVSNVLGLGTGRSAQVDPQGCYHLRVTLLSSELEQIAADWTPEAIGELDLDGRPWQVVERYATPNAHSWADSVRYEEIAAPLLQRPSDLPRRWTIRFTSPVTFRRRGMNMPLPLPELVFGGLLDQWNAAAPIALPEEVRRYAEECIAVSRYDLHTVPGVSSGGVIQIGALGRCTYVATNHDRYWLACIETLARFAFYGGVGAGVTRGFGQARLEG